MPNSLRRHALTAIALCLFALPAAVPRAQDKPGQQAPPPPPGGGGPGPGAAPVDYTRPFPQREVTKKAIITFKPEPVFTTEALDNDVYGVVRLRAILSSSGEVTGISIVKGLPDGLTEEALAAARRIRFTPAQKDGRAVSQYVVLEYNFNHYDDGSMAKIVEQPQPEYTEEARRNRVAGKVVLDVRLRRDGTVDSLRVLEGLPHGLSEKAVEAALRIKFKPAELRGRKITVIRTLEYTFKLD